MLLNEELFTSNKLLLYFYLRPRPHVAGYLRKRRLFFSEYSYHPHVTGVFGTENGGFQIRSPVWRVLKTEIHLIRVDGRKRRFSNTMTSCPGSGLARLHIRFENAKCGRRFFFKYGEKTLRFQKYPATCGWSNKIQKSYVWTHIFLNTEEKISFSKIPGYVWTRPEKQYDHIKRN